VTTPRPRYTAGCQLTKVERIEFNPASRDHIANRLMTLYGWKPLGVHRRWQATGGREVSSRR
jgi:hypothetical protein